MLQAGRYMRHLLVAIISIALVLTMMSLIPGVMEKSYADDSRTPIVRVDFTTDDSFVAPELGQELFYPVLYRVDPASPVRFSRYDWQKWDETRAEWKNANTDIFTEGDWRYLVTIIISEPDSQSYYIDPSIVTTVDTIEWDKPYGCVDYTDEEGNFYSYTRMSSPTFTVTTPADMPLTAVGTYSIPISYVGKNIEAFNISAAGGTAPYSFSKISGPSWIQVSANGRISGIPTAAGTNEDLVVGITDSAATPATEPVTIPVGKTYVAPGIPVKDLASMTLSTTTYTYNGSVKTPAVTVKDADGKTLVKNTDYTVSYASGRKAIGTYKVTVTGKGNYTGSLSKTFQIKPAKVSILTPKAGKKAVTVKWKKSGGGVYYQVGYKLKTAKSWKTTTSKTTYKTIKKLSSKKYYNVRVRAYKKVGTKTYYGAWSSTKTVRIK